MVATNMDVDVREEVPKRPQAQLAAAAPSYAPKACTFKSALSAPSHAAVAILPPLLPSLVL